MGRAILGRINVQACQALLVIPPLLLGCASVAWTLGGFGGGGLWPPAPITISEAAATKNTGEAARLISLGVDPNKPALVPEGLLPGGQSVMVTPLEVAVAVRRTSMFQMLMDYGARVDASRLRTLRCYSERFHDAETQELLKGLSEEPWPQCEPADGNAPH
jgi:hypothetical protein